MRTKIITILEILIIIIIILYKEKLELKKENTELYKNLENINKSNIINIKDFKNKTEELIIRNEELKSLLHITETLSNSYNNKDCINQPINNDIIKLLKKNNI